MADSAFVFRERTQGEAIALHIYLDDVSDCGGPTGKKTHLQRHLILKTIILPRQARDKHRGSTRKQTVLLHSGGGGTCWLGPGRHMSDVAAVATSAATISGGKSGASPAILDGSAPLSGLSWSRVSGSGSSCVYRSSALPRPVSQLWASTAGPNAYGPEGFDVLTPARCALSSLHYHYCHHHHHHHHHHHYRRPHPGSVRVLTHSPNKTNLTNPTHITHVWLSSLNL